MMKKIYLALICLVMSVSSVVAQTNNTVVFTDGDGGAVLADGATITRNHVDGEPFGGFYIHSGLFVKNTAATGGTYMSVEQIITSLPAGSSAQICINGGCQTANTAGTLESAVKPLVAGASTDLLAEWFVPTNYTKCSVTYRIKYYVLGEPKEVVPGIYEDTYDFTGYGPSVTVVYDYADPASINGVSADKEVASESYYSILGRKMDVAKGLCIKKIVYADGTHKCVKVVVK